MKLSLFSNIARGGGTICIKTLIFVSLIFAFSCKNRDNIPASPQLSEITITVSGDSNVKVAQTPLFKVQKKSKWVDIKQKANEKISFNDDFEFASWHISNQNGAILLDTYEFNEDTTVYAVSQAKPPLADVRWQSVACGDGSTYAIRNDGSLWVCGWNETAQLGLNNGVEKVSSFTRVGSDTNWSYAVGGQGYAFFIKTDGTLWAVGLKDKGVQGTNATVNNKVPTQIGTDTDWATVQASRFFAKNGFAIKNNGEIWGWGDNLYRTIPGQTKPVITTPKKLDIEGEWKAISTGESHVLAIRKDGTLWGWGSNQNRALGLKDVDNIAKTPTQIGTDNDWAKVRAVTSRSYAIKNDGSLWACGHNEKNRVGLNQPEGSVENFISEFTRITMVQGKVIDISGDEATTIVACGENDFITEVYAWGLNADGALGDGNGKLFTGSSEGIPYHITPIKVLLPENIKYSMICSGQAYSMILSHEGKLYGWGRNKGGQLGDKTDVDQLNTSFYKKPIEIECPKD